MPTMYLYAEDIQVEVVCESVSFHVFPHHHQPARSPYVGGQFPKSVAPGSVNHNGCFCRGKQIYALFGAHSARTRRIEGSREAARSHLAASMLKSPHRSL